jgi:hypothetical protein
MQGKPANLLHNDTSMDEVPQLESALGAKFENLFGKMLTNVKYVEFSATLSTSCILGLLRQKNSRHKSGVASKWEKPWH